PTTDIYTLSLHDALPIYSAPGTPSLASACSRRFCCGFTTASSSRAHRRLRLGGNERFANYFCNGCKRSFCARQFRSSATNSVFSEGQEISCTQPNWPSCLPGLPKTPRMLPSRSSLYMRPLAESEVQSACLGPGVMQVDQGAPALVHCFRKFPSLSKTWMRLFSRSPTKTFPFASAAMACTVRNSPGASPRLPHSLTQLPSLSNFTTRELL